MSETNTISTIIPFYNSEKTLPIMLESILGGIVVPDEILLIDDGSTDNSAYIAKDYASRTPFIKYLHQNHRGVSAARNLGIASSTGDWISFLDSDDYIEPDMYSSMLNSINSVSFHSNIKCDGCICGYFTHINNVVTAYYGNYTDIFNSEFILESMFTDDNIRGFLFTRLFRSGLIKNLSFDTSEKTCEDLLFQSQLFSNNNYKFAYVSKPLYHYVIRNGSASASLNLFENNNFIYKSPFDKIANIIKKSYVNDNYNSIIEHSMYRLLKAYNSNPCDQNIKSQIRKLQKELRTTPVQSKSKRRIAYEHAPFIFGKLFLK